MEEITVDATPIQGLAVLTQDLRCDLIPQNPLHSTAENNPFNGLAQFLVQMRARHAMVVHLRKPTPNHSAATSKIHSVTGCSPSCQNAHCRHKDLFAPQDLLVTKTKDSGFYNTDLHQHLQTQAVDTLVVTGVITQICLQSTAADAFFHGYNVWVAEDYFFSQHPSDKERALRWLDTYCATVSPAQSLLMALDHLRQLPRKSFQTSPSKSCHECLL